MTKLMLIICILSLLISVVYANTESHVIWSDVKNEKNGGLIGKIGDEIVSTASPSKENNVHEIQSVLVKGRSAFIITSSLGKTPGIYDHSIGLASKNKFFQVEIKPGANAGVVVVIVFDEGELVREFFIDATKPLVGVSS